MKTIDDVNALISSTEKELDGRIANFRAKHSEIDQAAQAEKSNLQPLLDRLGELKQTSAKLARRRYDLVERLGRGEKQIILQRQFRDEWQKILATHFGEFGASPHDMTRFLQVRPELGNAQILLDAFELQKQMLTNEVQNLDAEIASFAAAV